MLGASALRLGDRDCVVVGGMESMFVAIRVGLVGD